MKKAVKIVCCILVIGMMATLASACGYKDKDKMDSNKIRPRNADTSYSASYETGSL